MGKTKPRQINRRGLGLLSRINNYCQHSKHGDTAIYGSPLFFSRHRIKDALTKNNSSQYSKDKHTSLIHVFSIIKKDPIYSN